MVWSVLTLWTFVFLSERSFKSCLLSWFFLWHLLWLSVMQLRHYLFIGTLNPMLNHLSGGDPGLGTHTHTVLSSCPAIYVQVNPCLWVVCVDIDMPTGCVMCASWAWTLSSCFCSQSADIQMRLRSPSCVGSCVHPGTASSWTATRESSGNQVNTHFLCHFLS